MKTGNISATATPLASMVHMVEPLARMLRDAHETDPAWQSVHVRRLGICIEESLYHGTQWVVFEPNDEVLWSALRLNVGAFLHGFYLRGLLKGGRRSEAYFVKCDRTTTTQADIDSGIVNIDVGFAPLEPGEFVVIRIRQRAQRPPAPAAGARARRPLLR